MAKIRRQYKVTPLNPNAISVRGVLVQMSPDITTGSDSARMSEYFLAPIRK
jgi:hypothetical protein